LPSAVVQNGSMAIKNYSDHAANERTFLAWVRTAIAVMAFGFLVEKFDLFLKFAAASLGKGAPVFKTGRLAGWSGLALIVLGLAIVVVATVRLIATARKLDDGETHLAAGSKLDVALAVLLTLLGTSLLVYVLQNLLAAGSVPASAG
jgi:putative membrane protein